MEYLLFNIFNKEYDIQVHFSSLHNKLDNIAMSIFSLFCILSKWDLNTSFPK